MKRLLPLALLVLAQPAFAQTVTETDFVLTIPGNNGAEDVVESTTLIPLLPGACYNWWLKLAKTKGNVTVTEIFTLPGEPAGWGSVNDTTIISEDNLTATSTMDLAPDSDGWIGHGWCVAEGDPTGLHHITVKAGERVLGEFPFQVEDM